MPDTTRRHAPFTELYHGRRRKHSAALWKWDYIMQFSENFQDIVAGSVVSWPAPLRPTLMDGQWKVHWESGQTADIDVRGGRWSFMDTRKRLRLNRPQKVAWKSSSRGRTERSRASLTSQEPLATTQLMEKGVVGGRGTDLGDLGMLDSPNLLRSETPAPESPAPEPPAQRAASLAEIGCSVVWSTTHPDHPTIRWTRLQPAAPIEVDRPQTSVYSDGTHGTGCLRYLRI